MDIKFDIGVVACKKRRPIITDHLDTVPVPYVINYGPDPKLPKKFRPKPEYAKLNLLGHYRAFLGHQLVSQKLSKEASVIFEDDARPTIKGWVPVVNSCVGLLGSEFDVIMLFHRAAGRDFRNPKKIPIIPIDKKYYIGDYRKITKTRLWGGSAYILSAEARQRVIDFKAWNKFVPLDHWFRKSFRLGILRPRIFTANEGGSLVRK